MSVIKSIKQVLGLSGTPSENHFWDGSVANQLSLKRGTPDTPGAELIKALNGVLSFPNQGQQMGGVGYLKLPGGLIIQWGNNDSSVGILTLTFPVPFPNAVFQVLATCAVTANIVAVIQSQSVSGASILSHIGSTGAAASTPIRWIAIGY